MALQEKYRQLIDAAYTNGVSNLSVKEQNNVLYINGSATGAVKDKLWSIYNSIDPDMRSADVVMNIEADASSAETYTVVSGDSLSKIAKRYPGMTWNDIFKANQDQLSDPDKIFPGQVLNIPKG
ncbi:MAG: LysM peptidoglycan-binding domain-containing protein [Chitinophagaceae bacterium]